MARTRFLALSATLGALALGCTGPKDDTPLPATCADIRTSSINSTDEPPPDGIFTLYVAGEPSESWDVYCQDMRRADPPEYLPVDPAHNFAWLKSGDETLLETRYERLRFDPTRLELDLTDMRFATSTGTRRNLPPAWVHLPAGFAHYDATALGGGLSAESSLDLTGTPLAFLDEPAADPAFCRSSSSDQDIVSLFHTGEDDSSCDPLHCWSGACTTDPLTDAGVDDPPADMAVAAPDAAQPDAALADVFVSPPPDAAVVTPADGSVAAPADGSVVAPRTPRRRRSTATLTAPPCSTTVPAPAHSSTRWPRASASAG